jgi:hypothetical protein
MRLAGVPMATKQTESTVAMVLQVEATWGALLALEVMEADLAVRVALEYIEAMEGI